MHAKLRARLSLYRYLTWQCGLFHLAVLVLGKWLLAHTYSAALSLQLSLQERVALRAVIRGRTRLRHNFQRNGSCTARLTLALRNCSDAPVSVCVEPASGALPAGIH